MRTELVPPTLCVRCDVLTLDRLAANAEQAAAPLSAPTDSMELSRKRFEMCGGANVRGTARVARQGYAWPGRVRCALDCL